MAIGIQYGDPLSAGRAAFEAGKGEYGKYLQQFGLQVQELQQKQQQIDLAIEEAVQRERMQQRDIGFRDVAQQRDINLSDRSRRETFANSNAQLQYSTQNENQRFLIGQDQTNRRLTFSEQQQNARTSAQLTVNRLNTINQIQAQQQSQANSILANERMALFNAQDARQRAVLGAQLGSAQSQQQAQQQAYLQSQSQQQQLANQQELLGFDSYADRDAYNSVIQPSNQMQQFYQQRAQLEQQYEYTEADQQQLQKIQQERSTLRQGLAQGRYDAQSVQSYSQQLDRLEQSIVPQTPKVSPQDRFRQSGFEQPGFGYIYQKPDGSFGQLLPERTSPELERQKIAAKQQADQAKALSDYNSQVFDTAKQIQSAHQQRYTAANNAGQPYTAVQPLETYMVQAQRDLAAAGIHPPSAIGGAAGSGGQIQQAQTQMQQLEQQFGIRSPADWERVLNSGVIAPEKVQQIRQLMGTLAHAGL